MQRRDDGGLGTQLIGDKIAMNHRCVQVSKLLGEGGFSYVYLVKDISDKEATATSITSSPNDSGTNKTNGHPNDKNQVLVLKVTSIHSRQQRDIAEKEAKLLSRLSHPSIIKMYDSCYRTAPTSGGLVANIVGAGKDVAGAGQPGKDGRPQHLILMEYCEGGHALDVCNKLANAGQRFDLSALIIAFGQICNAVSYLHAQRPPIVHRDLKPVNFLVKNGAYKLCDFGSAVFGHVELKSQRARAEAEEVIQKTTTQMFRAPEMVDLFMVKKLTQSTDVWALGCCLYSLAFLQNCFEEGSNLAIINRNYIIPEDNPYGEGLVELIDRMLTVDSKARADMTEVILCLSAIYSGRPLPPRKKVAKSKKAEEQTTADDAEEARAGTFNTGGQGVVGRERKKAESKKPAEGKKLDPNSAAARRRRQAQGADLNPPARAPGGPQGDLNAAGSEQPVFDASFPEFGEANAAVNEGFAAFSTDNNPFAGVGGTERKNGTGAKDGDMFPASFEQEGDNTFNAFGEGAAWGEANAAGEMVFPVFSPSGKSDSGSDDGGDSDLMEAQMAAISMSGSGDTGDHPENRHRHRNRRSATGPKKEPRREEKPKRRSSFRGAAAI
eukprot:CAMPEP_0116840582 /NCGR_PEP_ID=MMETSP0418-20121206/10443_1 /TAXON_ID=1158023 /ORGANISM="Astrosyne radiata, Strain 13vi08-1A" /LENGTH=607 /DNA_ID=CAMNT_0004470901 /DNA_START=285 /DNA_END=2109 /DNA_ORIENTATION=+